MSELTGDVRRLLYFSYVHNYLLTYGNVFHGNDFPDDRRLVNNNLRQNSYVGLNHPISWPIFRWILIYVSSIFPLSIEIRNRA